MKKINYAIAAFAVILAGCAKVNEIETNLENTNAQTENVVTLHASVPNEEDTKVSTDNGGAFLWQSGDAITVLNTAGNRYEFTTSSNEATASFTSTTFEGILSTEAFYPASANHESGKFYLEPSITWAENASMMPMLGTVNTSTQAVSFKATGAVLKLVCYNVDKDADKLVVTSASKQIVGLFTPSSSPKQIAATDAATNKVLTINFEKALAARNMVFYIPLPIGNVGILTFTFKKGDTKVFEKATTSAVTLTRNKMLVAPVINCVDDIVLWSEDFSSFGSGTTGYGGASITYTTNDSGTKTYNEENAGGSKPELLIKGNKTLVVSGIPTNSATSMTLKYKTNAKALTLSSSTNGVSISPNSSNTKAEHTAKISNTKGASSFNITFTAGSDNVRIDDISVTMTPSYAGASSITPADNSLSIEVASGSTNSASTTFTYSNPVDDFDVVCSVNSEAAEWLSAEISGTDPYTLTVTAPKNTGIDKRDGKVTLRATGVTKTINVTQPGSKVATPTFSKAAGTYGVTQSVELACTTVGATIHYTTDGTNPTSSSETYSTAISVSSTTTIKAIAVKDNYTDSEVASATYTITDGAITETLTVGTNGGTWTNGERTSSATRGNVTFTALFSVANDGKYYSSDNTWRFYTATTSGVRITVPSTKKITSVVVNWKTTAPATPSNFNASGSDPVTYTPKTGTNVYQVDICRSSSGNMLIESIAVTYE